MALPPWMPGEALLVRVWESIERLGTGLLSPYQIKREGKARAEVRRYEMLSDAQTRREIDEVSAGRLIIDGSGKLVPPPTTHDSPAGGRREPQLFRSSGETLFLTANSREHADGMLRLLNLRKTIVLAEEEVDHITQSDASTEETEHPIDADWLYRWKEKAERISVEEMQRLWGKILIGETRQPGSFSLRTLELFFSITKVEAQLIADVAKFCVKGYNQDLLVYRDPTYLEAKGLTVEKLLILDDIGILLGVQGPLTYNFAYQKNGEYNRINFFYNGKTIVVHKGEGDTLNLPVYIMTNSGRELLKLGQFDAVDDYLTACARHIKQDQNLQVLIAEVDPTTGSVQNLVEV